MRRKPYPAKRILRGVEPGERLKLLDPWRNPWIRGARRKNHWQGVIVLEDGDGLLWSCSCKGNPYNFEVTGCAVALFP